MPSRHIRTVLLTGACITALIAGQGGARAETPAGGNIIFGKGSIFYGADNTTITQSSQKALITWDSFSISSGSSVDFLQPNSSAITLNRVLGSSPSTIDGSLFATGQVWLINANGVLFGKGSQVNVGGLIATTSDMRNSDFIAGNYNFSGASANANASVVNQGTIKTSHGGAAILAGSNVTNQGLIQADLGNVVLAGASTFSVDFSGDNLLRFAIVDPVTKTPVNSDGSAKQALVSNSGTISANGGKVLMTARAASNVVDNVVNNTGMIQATSVSSKNGEIVLDAGNGTAEAGGTLDASGTAGGESGGTVQVLGKNVQVADGATIDASGATGGGTILIGGNFHGAGPQQDADTTTIGNATITADATQKGNGGEIAVWSNDKTVFNGSISARGGASGGNGGYVETSGGALQVDSAARVNTLAAHGKTGSWLLDPQNIDIIDGGQDGLGGSIIDPNTIVTALASTNVELEATQNITVDSAVDYSSANAFTLLAGGNINANASVQNSGLGAINLVAGWDGHTTDLGSLANSGVYGNNGGSVVIGGEGARGGDVSVGSFGGETMVAGANVVVDAENGVAQIGYHGAGNGDIDVLATANVVLNADIASNAQIGNGGPGVGGTIGGDISVTAFGGEIGLQADSANGESIAAIGNVGGPGASESGDVTINTNGGMLALASAGADSFAQVGNWTVGDTTGTSSGAISIDTGALEILADGVQSYAGIGNGVFHAGNDSGALSGDIDIATGTLVVDSEAGESGFDQARIGNLGNGVVTGDIDITTAGDLTIMAAGSVSSTGSVASIGNVSNLNQATGNIDVQSGGNISLLATDIGEARIETGGLTGGTISVTAQDDIVLSTSGGASSQLAGSALIGTLTGNADISVTSLTGKIEMDANGDDSTVQIGNAANNQANSITGDVTVVASDLVNGNIILSAGGEGANAQIGNSGSGGGPVAGDILLEAGNTLELTGGLQTLVGNSNPGGTEFGSVTIDAAALAGDPSASLFNDLSYGDFALNLSGDAALVLPVAADYASAHALTISNGGDIVFDASLQNAGTGAITINAGGNVVIGGENGSEGGVAVGSFGGTTTITGANVTLEADNGYAQIGYHGAGGGNIVVQTPGDLSLVAGGNTGLDAQIGNGALSGGSGDVTGDIALNVAGTTSFMSDIEGGTAWLGNVAQGEANESGNVTLITGDIASNVAFGGANSLGAMMVADLGSSASNGGDFTLALTAPRTDFINTYLDTGAIDYSSPHALTLLSAENITLPYSLQNDGTGALTILAGWNPNVAPDAVLTTPGAYGNNSAFIWVVGDTGILTDYNPLSSGSMAVDSGAGAAIGTRGGTLTIGGAQIYVEGLSGYAQIGYHGDGGSGDIDVIANGVPGDGGLSGINACFDGNANICVIGGRQGATLEQPSYAQIGDLGLGVQGSASSNINISATGNIAVAGGGIYDDGTDPEIADAYGLIGNGDAAQTVAQTVSGTIVVDAGGSMNFASSAAEGSVGWLGNRTGSDGNASGDLTLVAASLHGDDLGQMFASDLGNSDDSGGDVTLALTGPGALTVNSAVTYDSPHTLSLLAAGDIVFEASVQNQGSGAINLVAGWNGGTLDPAQFTAQGVYGNNNGSITIGGEGADGDVAVGSAGGAMTMAAADVNLLAVNGYAQIGYHGAGSGDITVDATDTVTLTGGAAGGQYAQIGNGGETTSGNDGGDIAIDAGGDIALAGGAGEGAYAQIGHGGAQSNENSEGYSYTGNIALAAANVTLAAGAGDASYAQIGHGGFESGLGLTGGTATDSGDITVNATQTVTLTGNGDDAYAQIGNGGDQANAHAAAGAHGSIGGDIVVQTADGGSIVLQAGGGSNAYVQIGNGGYGINAPNGDQPADFTIGGDITVSDLSLAGGDSGANAFAQIGNGDASQTGFGDISGDIVIASGDITVTNGTAADSQAFIGNATGTGTVIGTVTGYSQTVGVDLTDPTLNSVVVSSFATTSDLDNLAAVTNPDQTSLVAEEPAAPKLVAVKTDEQSAPIADLAGDSQGAEGHKGSDSVATEVVLSLSKVKPSISRVLLSGMLREFPATSAGTPRGVPSADQEFSSWGNEALWQ